MHQVILFCPSPTSQTGVFYRSNENETFAYGSSITITNRDQPSIRSLQSMIPADPPPSLTVPHDNYYQAELSCLPLMLGGKVGNGGSSGGGGVDRGAGVSTGVKTVAGIGGGVDNRVNKLSSPNSAESLNPQNFQYKSDVSLATQTKVPSINAAICVDSPLGQKLQPRPCEESGSGTKIAKSYSLIISGSSLRSLRYEILVLC